MNSTDLTEREKKVLKELQNELRMITEDENKMEEEFLIKTNEKEKEMKDIQVQLREAQDVEAGIRAELARVKNDIEVLEKKNVGLRSEMSTLKNQQREKREVERRRQEEHRERLSQFLQDIKD